MRSWLVIASCVLISAQAATAQTVLFNSNGFEPYVQGGLLGQNGWNNVLTTNGAAQYTVQNAVVAGGTQAVQLTGSPTQLTRAWAWPSVNYTPAAGEFVRVQVDIALAAPTAPGVFGAYGIEVFDSAGDQTVRFGLYNDAGTIRPFYLDLTNPGGAFVTVNQAVAPNTFVNFDAELNYTTKTMRLYLNGTQAGGNIPFVTPTVTNFGDADLQIDADAGAAPGYFDNYRIFTTFVPVPEPMTCGVVAAAAGLIAVVRRKRVAGRAAA